LQEEYRRAESIEGIYTTMYDAHKVYQICGIYQTTAKDIWQHLISPVLPRSRQQEKADLEEVDAWFAERAAHEDNDMTGLFAGKNVVLVLMESMDDWLINEEDTPTISRLMDEGINFTNFYTPGFGSVRTFNSEFCMNTGLYLPTNGRYAFDYCNNDFSESLPSLFRAIGYSAEAFHYNEPSFYNRGVMEPAMGFEAYNSYQDFGVEGDDLYSDTVLFENESLLDKFYGGEEDGTYTGFFSFIISRSAHMTYSYDEGLSAWALEQYPQYQGSTGNEELDCIRAKARCCDDLFAALLDSLEERGELENTVIIGVADHYAYGMVDQGVLLDVSGVDETLLLEKTPCFIWTADKPSLTVDKVANTSDLVPTLVNLFGLESDYRYLGQDIFDESYEGYAVFQYHQWLNASAAYEDGAIIADFDGVTPSDDEVAEWNALAQRYIQISNLLLESDYYSNSSAR
jgi:phosphoglycerol transferase MdoB-like AlkP superfamily enzyme